jgi:RNA polymerase sigma-70 factor (ECF subfamily)
MTNRETSDHAWTTLDVSAESFGELFTQYADAVYNHCFRRCGDWAAAEDLTSLSFMHAWRRRHDAVLLEGSPLPWLLGVANNLLRNQDRTLRRQRALIGRIVPDTVAEDPSDDVAERVDDERRMREIKQVLQDLPRRELEVLELVAWDGLSYQEAAVALDIPIGTVRSRLSRAKKRISASGVGIREELS